MRPILVLAAALAFAGCTKKTEEPAEQQVNPAVALARATPPVTRANEKELKQGSEAAAEAAAPVSFDAKPAVGTMAKCPVSGEVFKIMPDTEFSQHEGRHVAFCCAECKPKFDADPKSFFKKKL